VPNRKSSPTVHTESNRQQGYRLPLVDVVQKKNYVDAKLRASTQIGAKGGNRNRRKEEEGKEEKRSVPAKKKPNINGEKEGSRKKHNSPDHKNSSDKKSTDENQKQGENRKRSRGRWTDRTHKGRKEQKRGRKALIKERQQTHQENIGLKLTAKKKDWTDTV